MILNEITFKFEWVLIPFDHLSYFSKQELIRQLSDDDAALQSLLKNQDEQNKHREQQLRETIEQINTKVIYYFKRILY